MTLSSIWIQSREPIAKFIGPAFAVSIGYMDPGNWATDLAAGAFGYRLLWVVVLANAIALVLQLAVTRLTADTGEALATSISRRWPRLSVGFWVIFQAAAAATDVAEFSGIVLGLELLFHLALLVCVVVGLVLVAGIFRLTDRTSKALEYALIAAVAAIAAACLSEIPFLQPVWANVLHGALVPAVPSASALVLVVGIIGATVMPHNLFLHSSLIAKNFVRSDAAQRRAAARFFSHETVLALNIAAVVNGGILVIGAALHGADGSIQTAFAKLGPTGLGLAEVFGGGILLSGIAASTTATVSGDYIFAALSPFRCPPLVRRAVTVIPAAVFLTCGVRIADLLVWSQVALALVLPVVLVPLLWLMLESGARDDRSRWPMLIGALTAALACVGFDAVMIAQSLNVLRISG